jgi:predicted homoserine dehydrogenase-like protein
MKTGKTGAGKLSRKLLAILAMSGMSLPGIANEVYIEQVGSSSTIAVTQDGSDNRVGSSLTPSYIGSGSNTVTIDQIGANNELDLVVNGAGTDVIVDITGSTNISTINCGTTQSAGCSGSFIKQAVTGDSNTITQNLGGGANHTSEITIAGSDNIVSHTSTATGTTSADITVTGDTNTVAVTQSGMLNKNVVVNSTGSLNNISITQSD